MDHHSQHTKALETLCRICSRKLGRVSYSTSTPAAKGDDTSLIEVCFKTEPDNPAINPPRFCNSCYLTMKRMKKAKENGTVYRYTDHPLHHILGKSTGRRGVAPVV